MRSDQLPCQAGRFASALSTLAVVLGFVLPAAAQAPAEAPAGRAWGEKAFLHIEVGDYRVRFWEKAAWTIASVDYQGHALLTHTGAYHSVLKIRGSEGKGSTWIGTGHGGEEIESLTLEVDGIPHEIETDLSVTGSTFTLVKTSILGPYRHVARVRVTDQGIVEDFDYKMQGRPVDLDRMYAFMHCFNNDTEQWLVGLGDGVEARGTFTDDNSFTLKKDIRWAMVYAPSMEVGIAYAYPEVYAGVPPLKNAFWNRPHDNKLYLTVLPSQEAGAVFNYTVRLKGFAAPEQDWESVGRQALETLLTAKARE